MRTKFFARVVSMGAVAGIAAVASATDELTLPAGFSATVVHEGSGAGRHLAIRDNGDLYLASRNGLLALRDKDGDFKADEAVPFGDVKGTGVQIFDGFHVAPFLSLCSGECGIRGEAERARAACSGRRPARDHCGTGRSRSRPKHRRAL